MGNINSGRKLYKINESFFKNWNSNMAYILGFTSADGNVHNKTLSWDLSDKFRSNLDLLISFNKVMNSDYPIIKRKNSYRLKISNRVILEDIKKLGIVPDKTKILLFPDVPDFYLSHFIRGFLDGDGWVVTRCRENKYYEICVGFSNGSYNFMLKLIKIIREKLGISKFNLRCREKKTKYGLISKTYQLEFYSENAFKILYFLYNDLSKNDLFLERKYLKNLEARNYFNLTKNFKEIGRKQIRIESKYNQNLKVLLNKYIVEGNILPRHLADEFGISLSTLYRWLDKYKIRSFEKRGSEEWSKRIVDSKRLIKNG